MNKERMKTVTTIVKEILERCEFARKNDFLLVVETYEKLGISSRTFTLADLCELSVTFKLPPFESITRARRKLQKEYPFLADAETQEARAEQEVVYKDFARERV